MKNIKVNYELKLYLQWPVIFSVFIILMNIGIYFVNIRLGLAASIFFVVFIIFAMMMYYYRTPKLLNMLVKYAANYDKVQNQLLKEMMIPYAILDSKGAMLWGNEQFIGIIENEKAAKRSIFNIFTDMSPASFPKKKMVSEVHLEHNDVYYRIMMNNITISDLFMKDNDYESKEEKDIYGESLVAMYLYDETEVMRCMKENNEQRAVIGLIYLDNYEEVFDDIDEVKRALLAALVERKITKYMQGIESLVKKLEKDKYLVVFKKKYLTNLQANKFSILDEVRAINVGNDIAMTLSFGIGVDADTPIIGYEFARAAIDLALGRGGDQVVIKDKEKLVYYGGKSVQIEKSTRVKARVKAHALKEIIIAKDNIMVMGHSIGDVDSFGAAVGLCRIAKTFGKKAHIVINEVTTSVQPFMDRFKSDVEYDSEVFLKSERALEVINENTLLIVVDVNRPNYTECPELISKTKSIVVLDHHRQTGEAIENATLSYIEPYASSTCEMVAEISQYVSDRLKLRAAEADAMYAGIVIDTNNFLTKTGVRTFEAAAYLRRSGADIIRIRKSLRTDMKEYKIKADAIRKVEIFLECFAMTECHAEDSKSPTIVGAQVANELLDIAGVKASFVLTPFNNKIYVSARSIDEANVQLIMEKFGGGGHMTVAGAQIEGKTMDEAKSVLRIKVAEMVGNEEI